MNAEQPNPNHQGLSADDAPTIKQDSDTSPPEEATLAPSTSAHTIVDSFPREFGDYELLEELARGGMGVVYRARQKSLNRTVALKMILAGQFASQEDVERFHVEAVAAANLDHEAIVPIYEIGLHDDHHYFTMKLIEGGHLGDRLCALREDLPTGIKVVTQVCHAIHHAHQRGILHRDLKPANILLDEEDQPYVTDLGLARKVEGHKELTQTGAIVGTPSYMAPEQAAGATDVTTAADIYSLGALLYKLITGRPPFESDSAVDTLLQVVSNSPCKPSEHCKVDRCLELICMKCLAKEPGQRYATAGELAGDLEKWLNGEPISITSPSMASVTRVWLKQNFGRVAWAFLIGPVFGIVSGLCLWYSTTHQKISSVIRTYDSLPSADRPMIWFPFDTPVWASTLLMSIFAILIVSIGFVTTVFVKPKNQGADLAAGAIVGVCAALAGFMTCLGSLGVLTSQTSDVAAILDVVKEYDAGSVHEAYAKYPELEGLDQVEQVALLLDKQSHDRLFTVPRGIWLGVIASLTVYFFPCLFEAYAAGPILRKHKTWTRSLVPYIETAFPVAILMTIFAVMFSTWLLYGAVGVLPSWSLWLLFFLIIIAVVVRRRTWRWPVRVAVQLGVAVMFTFFVVNDFLHVPDVSANQARIRQSRQRLAARPDDIQQRMKLSEEYANYANVLAEMNRKDLAIEVMDDAIDVVRDMNVELPNLKLELSDFRETVLVNKAELLVRFGQTDQALELLGNIDERYPGNEDVARVRSEIEALANQTQVDDDLKVDD